MIDDETALQWLFSFHEATIGRVKKGRPRLLLMDNHGSHTTHLCQLLDGQAFQSLKHHFHTMNNEVVTWGGSASKKRDSFRVIEGVREQALTQRTIRTSLKSRSIYPLDPEVVLTPLRQRDLEGPPLGFSRHPLPQTFQAQSPIHRQIQLSGLKSLILSLSMIWRELSIYRRA